jgi:hypothetical protein
MCGAASDFARNELQVAFFYVMSACRNLQFANLCELEGKKFSEFATFATFLPLFYMFLLFIYTGERYQKTLQNVANVANQNLKEFTRDFLRVERYLRRRAAPMHWETDPCCRFR